MESVLPLVIAAMLIDAIIEVFKMFREKQLLLEHYAAFVIGTAILWVASLNILTEVGLGEDGLAFDIVGYVVGGILLVRGSGAVHDLFGRIRG